MENGLGLNNLDNSNCLVTRSKSYPRTINTDNSDTSHNTSNFSSSLSNINDSSDTERSSHSNITASPTGDSHSDTLSRTDEQSVGTHRMREARQNLLMLFNALNSDAFDPYETYGNESYGHDNNTDADTDAMEIDEEHPFGDLNITIEPNVDSSFDKKSVFLLTSGNASEQTEAHWTSLCQYFQSKLDTLLALDRSAVNDEVQEILDNPNIDLKKKLAVVEAAKALKTSVTFFIQLRDLIEGEGDANASNQTLPIDTDQLRALSMIKEQYDTARREALSDSKHKAVGSSGAVRVNPDENKMTFEDVAGADEAIDAVKEVVDFLKRPDAYAAIGAKMPKGVLLDGPPGTGKTLLAKAVAGEAGVPFFYISGSNFVEVYVGTGAQRVRSLFQEARQVTPSIIFIDEIDAVGRNRNNSDSSEQDQTLNQLLTEMDGFNSDSGTIMIAATNRSDMLDEALTRPGRFDRTVSVPLPSVAGREAILKIHLKNISHTLNDQQVAHLASVTLGFSGAELANLVNEAAISAVRQQKPAADMDDFESMRDQSIMGAEIRTYKMSDQEKINTAYHESGHALVAALRPGNDPLHKVSIVPRGHALGITATVPVDDSVSVTHKQLLAKLAMMLGGRIAEELAFGKENITTGASSDLVSATQLARQMVTQWGFSDRIGSVVYGHRGSRLPEPSSETARTIDKEVHRIITACSNETTQLLQDNWHIMEQLKEALLEHETLDASQVYDIIEQERHS